MSNVTRDGDTVTVRCCYEPENDCLVIRPYDDDHFRPVLYGIPILERADLTALGYDLLALAGEPDWKALAMKLARLAIPEHLIRTRNLTFEELTRLSGEGNDAYAAITDAEWAALEGVQDE